MTVFDDAAPKRGKGWRKPGGSLGILIAGLCLLSACSDGETRSTDSKSVAPAMTPKDDTAEPWAARPLVDEPELVQALVHPLMSGKGARSIYTFKATQEGEAPFLFIFSCSGGGQMNVWLNRDRTTTKPCDETRGRLRVMTEPGAYEVRITMTKASDRWKAAVVSRG